MTIKECICSSIKEALYIDDISVDEKSTFSDLGVDSIVELEMIEYLNENLGIKLMPTDLFNYETIEQLTKYIQSEFSI